MVDDDTDTPPRVRWARLRFSIIGSLLSSPAKPGERWQRICELADRTWQHPTTGESLQFSPKTIERWFYAAKDAQNPIDVLERKVPKHAGTFPSVSPAVGAALRQLRKEHPRWSFQLVHDNLVALAKDDSSLGPLPGYATVCRYMKHHGLGKRPRRRRGEEQEHERRETRSYEKEHVHALWHFDFHKCSRSVLCRSGEWMRPVMLAFLDDHSRLCCHGQWYLAEDTESLVHGLSQALLKRGLPRAVLSDNGSAMVAAETREGLERLSITQATTLPRHPEQNGKQESFWGQVEGRLMAMVEGERELTLELLNRATQAWLEREYQRKEHSEIGMSPLTRATSSPSVVRPPPSMETLRRAFRMELTRKQRHSDGTCTVFGVRYEVPSRYRTLTRLRIRVARWELSAVDLVDPRSGEHLAVLLPLDKSKNSDGRRRIVRSLDGVDDDAEDNAPGGGVAPLLRKLMAEYAATGLPPAYLPKDDTVPADDDEENP